MSEFGGQPSHPEIPAEEGDNRISPEVQARIDAIKPESLRERIVQGIHETVADKEESETLDAIVKALDKGVSISDITEMYGGVEEVEKRIGPELGARIRVLLDEETKGGK